MNKLFKILQKTGLVGGPQSYAADWLDFYSHKAQGFSEHASDVSGRMNHAVTPYTYDQFSEDSAATAKLIQEFWMDATRKNLGPLGHTLWPLSSLHPDLVFAFHYKRAIVLEEDFITTVADKDLGASLWKMDREESGTASADDASGKDFSEHLQFQPRVVGHVARVQAKNHTKDEHLPIGIYTGLIYDTSSEPIHPLARVQVFVFPDPNEGSSANTGNTVAQPKALARKKAAAKKKATAKKKAPAKKKASAKKKAPAKKKASARKKSGRATMRR